MVAPACETVCRRGGPPHLDTLGRAIAMRPSPWESFHHGGTRASQRLGTGARRARLHPGVPGDLLDLGQPPAAEHRQLRGHQLQDAGRPCHPGAGLGLPRRPALPERRRPGRDQRRAPGSAQTARRAGGRGVPQLRRAHGQRGAAATARAAGVGERQPRRPPAAAQDAERRRPERRHEQRRRHARSQERAHGDGAARRHRRSRRRQASTRRRPDHRARVRSARHRPEHVQAHPSPPRGPARPVARAVRRRARDLARLAPQGRALLRDRLHRRRRARARRRRHPR